MELSGIGIDKMELTPCQIVAEVTTEKNILCLLKS